MTWNPPSDTEINVDKPIKAVDIRRIRDLLYWGYESAETTISTSGTGSITTHTHGLGLAPTDWQIVLVCQVIEHGYAVGDVTAQVGGDRLVGVVDDANTTQISVMAQSVTLPQVLHKTTRGLGTITAASWKYILRASPR